MRSNELGVFHSQASHRRLSVHYLRTTNGIVVGFKRTEYDMPEQYVSLTAESIDDLITTLQYARHLQKEQDNGGVPGTDKTN